MSTLYDVVRLIQSYHVRVDLFGITADAAREISALILALGDQIAVDHNMTNAEAAAANLPHSTELSEDAEIIFDQLKRLVPMVEPAAGEDETDTQ